MLHGIDEHHLNFASSIGIEKQQEEKIFCFSNDLAIIVGFIQGSRRYCIARIWHYILENNLQSSCKKYFEADRNLQKNFGKRLISVFAMSKYLMKHLS